MKYQLDSSSLIIYSIVHFTVTGENEAGVDLVLIQPFLLCYENHVVLMLTSIFLSIISIRKGKRFVSKQGQPQPHIHSKVRITVKWSILMTTLFSKALIS